MSLNSQRSNLSTKVLLSYIEYGNKSSAMVFTKEFVNSSFVSGGNMSGKGWK